MLFGVASDRFSKLFKRSCNVENIVHYLERSAKCLRVIGGGRYLLKIARKDNTHHASRLNKRAGFVRLKQVKLFNAYLPALSAKVDYLTADHAVHADSFCQHGNEHDSRLRRDNALSRGVCDSFKSQRIQSVASKQSGCLTVSFMTTRLAASEIVVVHTRQIVVYQRKSVYQLDGASGLHQPRSVSAAHTAKFQHEYRAQALAARRQRIVHRFADFLAQRRLFSSEFFQLLVYHLAVHVEFYH